MLWLRLVMGNVVLSLWSGGGDTLTRGLNEVRRKINGGALRNTYIHTRKKCSVQICFFFNPKELIRISVL